VFESCRKHECVCVAFSVVFRYRCIISWALLLTDHLISDAHDGSNSDLCISFGIAAFRQSHSLFCHAASQVLLLQCVTYIFGETVMAYNSAGAVITHGG
jgi:hypothetical protein